LCKPIPPIHTIFKYLNACAFVFWFSFLATMTWYWPFLYFVSTLTATLLMDNSNLPPILLTWQRYS
jgi:hypothetical protein